MAGRIEDNDIQGLRQHANIVEVIGEYTTLTAAGGARHRGLCPFHQEKTPSFYVDPTKGAYHCFGCDAGGDVYTFLQTIEHLTFPEAVERLARQVGYELHYAEMSPGQRKALGRRTRQVEALAKATEFFQAQLNDDGGAAARDYLAGRGISLRDAAQFRLGWAPDAWDELSRHLLANGFQPDELIDVGVSTSGRQGPMDRFRGRIVFPILERGGRDVIAFGGRILPNVALKTGPRDGSPPKYINSPETEVYRKSEILYALSWARAEIVRQQAALVVEGYMDVIALHLAGAAHAVATCGTALTVDHFRQLERLAPRVVLALDADDAGVAAAERGRALAAEVEIRDVGILVLPAGKDPADVAEDGPEAVQAALGTAQTAVEFQLAYLLRNADVATPEGQMAAYRQTFPLLGQLPDRFLRFSYIRDLVAPAVRMSADRIEAELDAQLARVPARPAPGPSPAPPSPGPAGVPRDPQLRLEREVLRCALQTPQLLPEAWKEVTPSDFTTAAARQLFEVLTQAGTDDLDAVLAALPDDETRARVRGLALADPLGIPDASKVAQNVARLRAASVRREIDVIDGQLAEVDAELSLAQLREIGSRRFALELLRRSLLEGGGA